jgi:hypothetical protein
MAFEHQGAGALDYFPCRYGKSKLLFRGPKRRLDERFVAAIGGTETYGKFVADPWPALVEQRLKHPVVNFGYLNAGVDVFLNEPEFGIVTRHASVTVLQLTGAQNLSNRFYAVHPRRNDRFLRGSQLMRAVFRDVDFTEFNFTRHMLSTLMRRAPGPFEILVAELRTAWVARMGLLLERMSGPVVLLHLGEYRAAAREDGLGADPLFVTQEMVDKVSAAAQAVVRVDPSSRARGAGGGGMYYASLDEPAAADMPGPLVHQEMAEALAPVIARFL